MENQELKLKIKLYGEANGRIEYAASLLSDLQEIMSPDYIEDDKYRELLIRRVNRVKSLLFEATDIIDGREAA
jgi:hypothetical protein